MRLLYIAHKIRDPRGPYWMVQHIRQAEQIAIELWAMGAAVITPGLNTYLMDGALPDDAWLHGDLEIISRCDAIVLAPNADTSEGAKREHVFCIQHAIRIFHWPHDKEVIREFIHPPLVPLKPQAFVQRPA